MVETLAMKGIEMLVRNYVARDEPKLVLIRKSKPLRDRKKKI